MVNQNSTFSVTKKIPIWNQRMILLMQHCIDSEIVTNQKEFLESIDFLPNNMKYVREGRQGFTISHMTNACKKYKVNMNWIVGIEDEMMRIPGRSAIQSLKEAVRAVEAQLSK